MYYPRSSFREVTFFILERLSNSILAPIKSIELNLFRIQRKKLAYKTKKTNYI